MWQCNAGFLLSYRKVKRGKKTPIRIKLKRILDMVNSLHCLEEINFFERALVVVYDKDSLMIVPCCIEGNFHQV